MKNLMKKLANPEVLATLGVIAFAVAMMVMPELALARADVKSIVGDGIFKDAITLAFGIFAFIKWIDYAAGFSTGNALTGLIVPALATFLAFKWTMVLGWFKLV